MDILWSVCILLKFPLKEILFMCCNVLSIEKITSLPQGHTNVRRYYFVSIAASLLLLLCPTPAMVSVFLLATL